MRVIIADSNRLLRETVGKLLSSAHDSWEVIAEAENGQGALDAVEKRLPDAIIIDVHLAGVNGFHLIEHLRNHYPDLKIIAIALEHYEGYRSKALAFGADDYCSKFDPPRQLLKSLRRVMGRRTRYRFQTPPIGDLAVVL